MGAYPVLHEGDLIGGEETPSSRFFNTVAAAVVEDLADPHWGPSDEPLILVSYQPRDVLSGLAASIEGSSPEESLVGGFADPNVESSDDELQMGPWVEAVAARLAQLLVLPMNWDGHNAGPVSAANVQAAGRFLAAVMAPSTAAPTIVPTSAGGLQLEWHRGGLDVELLFGEEDPPVLYVAEVDSGREWEGPPVEGFAEFDLAQRLGR